MSQSLAVPTGPSTMPATKLLGLMSALGVIGVMVERTLQQLETQLQSSELSREESCRWRKDIRTLTGSNL